MLFTPISLENTVKAAGFDPIDNARSFGGQYQWITCTVRAPSSPGMREDDLMSDLLKYSGSEERFISDAESRIRSAKTDGKEVVVWGMATKGVVFCNLIDPNAELIDYCIDINSNKQGGFVPHTGHLIKAPDSLLETGPDSSLLVLVMNPNYASEIKEQCADFSSNISFIDASGDDL
jgi:hypothetical protein